MRAAQPETRKQAIFALQSAIIEAKERPTRYGLSAADILEYVREQEKRIAIVKACG